MPRVGIVSDVHEDIDRLRQAFDVLDTHGCEEFICLGDSVGFSVPYYAHFGTRDAHAVLQLVRERCAVVVAGNHDHFAIRKLPEHRAGVQYPEDWYALPYRERERRLRGRVCLYEAEELSALLDPEDRAYLAALPEFVVREYPGLRVVFSHYAYPDLTGVRVFEVKTTDDAAEHLAFMARHGCTLGVSGHDHFEGIRTFTSESANGHAFDRMSLDRTLTWLHGPAVANGTYANGVLVLDTDELHVEAVPLRSTKHQVPAWRGEWRG